METFTPGPENPRALRSAFGTFPTGVCVVTTTSSIGPLGMTINSFSSVSLDPPLILWSPARHSLRFESFSTAGHFCVHVLGEHQRDLAVRFAKTGHDFSDLQIDQNEHGVPLFEGCASRFECKTHSHAEGGDHQIIIGLVEQVTKLNCEPLAFLHGKYGQFRELP